MKNLLLASSILLSAVAFGQTAPKEQLTEFIVRDAKSGQPLALVDAIVHNVRLGNTNNEGIIKLNVQEGDTVLFVPQAIIVEVNGGFGRKEYKKVTFVVPEKSYLNRQEILAKDLYSREEMEIWDLDVPPPAEPEPAENEPKTVVEQPAEFPGGMKEMSAFLVKNLVYPKSALEKELQGKCFVKFIVHKDGTISDVKIMRGVPGCPECDKEAIRTIKAMPKWIPAKNNGKIVDSYFNLPIHFALN